MVVNRLSVLVSGFGVGVGLVHTTLVAVSGCAGMFQDVSGSVVNGHDCKAFANGAVSCNKELTLLVRAGRRDERVTYADARSTAWCLKIRLLWSIACPQLLM